MDVNKKKNQARDARNTQILADAANGDNAQELADKYKLSKVQVYRILNSDQAREFAETQKNKILGLLDKAVDVLNHHLDKKDLNAASMAFKIGGYYVEKHEHSQAKPFILKLSDGNEIHMGHKTEKEK